MTRKFDPEATLVVVCVAGVEAARHHLRPARQAELGDTLRRHQQKRHSRGKAGVPSAADSGPEDGARCSRAVLRAAHQLEHGCGSAMSPTILRDAEFREKPEKGYRIGCATSTHL